MFDIPELDSLICSELLYIDLAQCARVCKKWHAIVTPFLWTSLGWIEYPTDTRRQQIFARMVLEDYLQYQLQLLAEEERCVDQHIPSSSSPSPSALAKYGHLIKYLPYPRDFLACFRQSEDLSRPQQPLEGVAKPTVCDLIRHIYERCPNAKAYSALALNEDELEEEDYVETIAEYIAPGLCSLYLETEQDYCYVECPKIKYLLSLCSSSLEDLTINVGFAFDDSDDSDDSGPETMAYLLDMFQRTSGGLYDGVTLPCNEEEQQLQEQSEAMLQLKSLTLDNCDDSPGFEPFWMWLRKRCGQVEVLQLDNLNKAPQRLADGLSTYMPHLDRIFLSNLRLSDETIAAFLSGSRTGWKSVSMDSIDGPMTRTCEVLMQHCSTLERLEILNSHTFEGHWKVQILSACSKLHTFTALTERSYWTRQNSFIDARSFIDKDPHTESLRTWACETSLKTLHVQITGIPRPDLQGDGVIPEAYPGHGRVIQGHVYDRLARLIKLETLWLEDKFRSSGRLDCPEMSLESGLYKLAGLKELKELRIWDIKARVGVPEVQWMVEQWPKLRVLVGLRESSGGRKAMEWLQMHHPEIRLS